MVREHIQKNIPLHPILGMVRIIIKPVAPHVQVVRITRTRALHRPVHVFHAHLGMVRPPPAQPKKAIAIPRAARHVRRRDVHRDIHARINHRLRPVRNTMVVRAVLPTAHVKLQPKRVIHHVRPYQTHHQHNPVPVRAVLQMVHVHTMDQHKPVMVNIPIRHANPPVNRVRDVRHGEHVAVAQSVLHVMRGIICPTGHVNSANLDTIVPGITIAPHAHRAMVRPPPAQPKKAIAIPL